MLQKSIQEMAETVAARYRASKSRKEKTKMLDEYCATTKQHRKYAIAKFKLPKRKKSSSPPRRGRKSPYTKAADAKLLEIWRAFDCICAERLHPFLPEAIRVLKRCKELSLLTSVEKELLQMSRATVGRRISSFHRHHGRGHGIGGTRPGHLLKKDIPIHTTWSDEEQKIAGHGEIDLVQHCGDSAKGNFINTLQYTDIETTWIERKAVAGKAQIRVFAALRQIEFQLPFPLRGIDSDNGSEFINHELFRYCKANNIRFTRSRPYKKNDNAHIEQKNWTCVRKILGYERFDTEEQFILLNDLYDNELRLFTNFFQPSVKLISKKRVGARIKRVYDTAKTPYQRVMQCSEATSETKQRLTTVYESLNPVLLQRIIYQKISKILSLSLR